MQLRSGLVVSSTQQYSAAPSTGVVSGTLPSAGAPDGAQREAAFREGVGLCLLQWTALQLAVENQWGGRNSARKAQEIGEDIVAWFAARAHKRGEDGTPRFYADELEDLLDEAVLQGFNLEVDDGSLEEVSKKVMEIHEQCWVGNFATVLQLQQEQRQKQERGRGSAAASSRRQPTDADDDSEDEDMEGVETNGRIPVGQSMAVDLHQADDQVDPQPQGAGAPAGRQERAMPGLSQQEMAMPGLSQQEMDDGWHQVPTTRGRRR